MLRKNILKELGLLSDDARKDTLSYAKVETPDTLDLSKYDHFVPTDDRPIEYPFELDDFQKQAFIRIYQGKHVFVSAHTSAGKTITAEWAIALALTNGKKAIYTSPIKALSNQKFRDFKVKFNKLDLDEFENDNYYGNDYYDDFDDGFDDFGGGGGYQPIYDFQGMRGGGEDNPDHVGIITGDVQVNKDAPCLVLTTEILRTMIYDNDKILQELEWVVFDEIHYMNDVERGRVWEEVITLLPSHVNMLFLSATTPNAVDFAEWVGRVKGREVYVISTSKRPTPLEHHLHVETHDKHLAKYYKTDEDMRTEYLDRLDPSQVDIAAEIEKVKTMRFTKKPLRELGEEELGFTDKDGMYCVVGKNGVFDEDMMRVVKQKTLEKGGKKRGENTMRSAVNFKQARHHWIQLFRLLRIKQKFPVVVFVFSKKRCVELTDNLKSEDYTTKREKSRIHVFIQKCLERIPEHDHNLPQIQFVSELLKRGIAVHHGGLLPILKEMTEILFAKGFIRILFATETFAMGINMPTRTVVFSSVSKHDGTQFRHLLPGEYTQMSGRAGRRGLDSVGTVIINNWKPNQINYKKMISGKPLELVSKFHLTYQTILNIWKQNTLEKDVTDLLRCSFSEFVGGHDSSTVIRINRLIREASVHVNHLMKQEPYSQHTQSCVEYWNRVETMKTLTARILESIYLSNALKKIYLSKGNHILVLPEDGLELGDMIIQDVFDSHLTACYPMDPTHAIDIQWEWIVALVDEQGQVYGNINKNTPRNCKIPIELAIQWSEVSDHLKQHNASLEGIDTQTKTDPAFSQRIKEIVWYQTSIKQLKSRRDDDALSLYPDYHAKTLLLKDMGYADQEEILTLKGRIASRINTSHALVFTEFLLEYGIVDLQPHEVASLLSMMIFTEGRGENHSLVEIGEIGGDLMKRRSEKLLLTVKRIYQKQVDCSMEFDKDKFLKENFHTGLAAFVYYWCQGLTFLEVLERLNKTDKHESSIEEAPPVFEVEEGTIVRAVMRLDEFCQEIDRAATVIGDPGISPLMQKTSESLRRDIIFCGSLYI